jgi:hypothetical protein
MFSTQSPTIEELRIFVNQLSPNLKDFDFYNAKKGDKISITCSSSNSVLQCEFVKYEIVELGTGFIKPFGPRNFKKARKIICTVVYTDSYGIKYRMRMLEDGDTESIIII